MHWQTGGASTHQLGTLIVNPPRNLLNFYFGSEGSGYFDALLKFIVGLTGTLVFVYFIADADDAGVPVYLETANPENVPYYRSFGFVETGREKLPRGAPLWLMLRRCASATAAS